MSNQFNLILKNEHMEIENIPVGELKAYDKNSRTHSKKQVGQVVESIKEFGFTNPLLVDEENVLIAGHGRLLAAKKIGMDEIPCVRLSHLNDAQKKAYVIADNKIALNSSWDDDLLRSELADLDELGFNVGITGFDDLLEGTGVEDSVKGEVEFSEYLNESHNYVVLYFENDIDWLQAQTHFNLKSVHSKRANGKIWSKGIGRVVNGANYLKEITE